MPPFPRVLLLVYPNCIVSAANRAYGTHQRDGESVYSHTLWVCITYLFLNDFSCWITKNLFSRQSVKETFCPCCQFHICIKMCWVFFFSCWESHVNYVNVLPAVLTCSLAPLSVDAGPVSLLLLEEAQGPKGGRVPRVRTSRRVGGHPRKCAQLRRGRWRRARSGKHTHILAFTH